MPVTPVFKAVLQVGLVVRDLDVAVRKYWDVFGIGPWVIYTMDGSRIQDLTVRGQPTACAFRVAFAQLGGVQLELIQPLDDRSIYAEFLKGHGEGLHHLACATGEGFEETLAILKGRGIGVLQGGTVTNGLGFAYLDTVDSLACITEIYRMPESLKATEPESTYP